MGIRQDLLFAARRLGNSPLFTLVAALSLAVGIGASTTVFSLVEALLIRDLPGVAEQDGLVTVHRIQADGESEGLSLPVLRQIGDAHDGLVGVAGFTDRAMSLRAGDEARLVLTQFVTGNYFKLLGTRPRLGRFFSQDTEATPGDDPVAVISHALWRDQFGSDPGVVGREIHVNGRAFTVIGVAEERFGGTFFGFVYDLWLPASMIGVVSPGFDPYDRNAAWLEVFGRLAPGVTQSQASVELRRLSRFQSERFPDLYRDTNLAMSALTGYDPGLRGPLAAFLAVLFAVTMLVLLMASLNVSNMLLARAVGRNKEMAIQLALGISRSRLIRQMLAESLLLAGIGGIAGVALAQFGIQAIGSFEPPLSLPLVFHVELNPASLSFAFLVLLLTGIAAGLAPALRAMSPNMVSALQETAVPGGGRSRLRRTFVVAQISVSLVLLIVTGLFLRTLQHAAETDPGFETRSRSVLTLDARIMGLDGAESAAIYRQLRERLESLPGVSATALGTSIPLGISGLLGGNELGVRVPGVERDAPGGVKAVEHAAVGPGYLDILGIGVPAGREFDSRDRPESARVVVVNRALARRLWPGENVIGQILEFEDGTEARVVGLTETGKYRFPGEDPRPFVYLAYRQEPSVRVRIIVRHRPGAAPSLNEVHRVVGNVAPDLPVLQWQSMNQAVTLALLPQRMAAWIAGCLGIVGLLLTALGVYGVVAFSVNARSREFGLRMCLGANRRRVIGMVIGEGLRLALMGIIVGLGLAFATTRFANGIVFGVSTKDPLTFLGVPCLLIVLALLASAVPARRATRVNPSEALRAQ